MNLEDLRAVQSDERGTDSLQSLPDSFYRDVADYVDGLRAERERAAERADSPFDSEEVRRLTDEIETAEEVVEAIYERRVGKVVKRASLAAAGMPADDEGLTDEESELFADLVSSIEANRRQVFAALEGDSGDGGEADAPAADPEPEPADGGIDAGDVMGHGADDPGTGAPDREGASPEPDAAGGERAPDPSTGRADPEPAGAGGGADAPEGRPTPPDEPPAGARDPAADGAADRETDPDPDAVSNPGTAGGAGPDRSAGSGTGGAPADRGPDSGTDERVTLRITRDVGEIFGVDERTYTLGEEDVVTLPAENAEPLLERDAAQKLE